MTNRRAWGQAPLLIAAIALCGAGALAAAAAPAGAPPDSAGRDARGDRPRPGSIDDRVRLLAAELGLDARQQLQVRQVLEEQRTLTLKAWSDAAVPAAVRIGATRAASTQTADRIRAILNDSQREKYLKPPPAPAPADHASSTPDLDSWLHAVGPN